MAGRSEIFRNIGAVLIFGYPFPPLVKIRLKNIRQNKRLASILTEGIGIVATTFGQFLA